MNNQAENQLSSRLQRMKNAGMITTGKKLREEQSQGTLGIFPGEEKEIETPMGSCFIRETAFPLTHRHGSVMLDKARECSPAALNLLMNSPPAGDIKPCHGLFLDLETTGLAGGTGTWAFLVGVGWLEAERFCIRQYFLRRPGEERAMLWHFAHNFAASPTLITFNGKAFDLPLINTRQMLTGISPMLEPITHIDLFHCSRRFWKDRFSSCSLKSLEKNLLNYHRQGDIPGAEIPAVYFNYLRRGKTTLLQQVFKHNCLDIITMAALLGVIGEIEKDDFLEKSLPQDCYTLGQLLCKSGETKKAEAYLLQVCRRGSKKEEKKALQALGFLYKQQGYWDASARCWLKLIENGAIELVPYVELAKLYEHKIKDLPEALRVTRLALNIALKRRQLGAVQNETHQLSHRLKRLESRLEKQNIKKLKEV